MIISGPDATVVYSENIPTASGYYVYRLWADDGTCLYVGRIGNNGPRPPQPRLHDHRRNKTWWPDVAKVEVAALPDHPAIITEEAEQIQALRPLHNRQRGNCTHDLSLPGAVKPGSGSCAECSRERGREHYRNTGGTPRKNDPASIAKRRETDRKRQPKQNAARRLRRRRPPTGAAMGVSGRGSPGLHHPAGPLLF